MHDTNAKSNTVSFSTTSKPSLHSNNKSRANPSVSTTKNKPDSPCGNKYTSIKQKEQQTSKIFFLNIQNLLPQSNTQRKLQYLNDRAKEENAKILIMTETHLTPDVLDEEITIPNFNVFRTDRINRKCGGVCILIQENLGVEKSKSVHYSNSVCEMLIIHIEQMNLHIICVYRPPDTTNDEFTPCIDKIESYLCNLPSTDNIMILGDFNFPFLSWIEAEDSVIYHIKSGAKTDEKLQAEKLLNLTNKYFMNQIITQPTRNTNTLDLIFLNNTELIPNHTVENESKCLSDHDLITCHIKEASDNNHPKIYKKPEKLRIFNYWSQKASWDKMNQFLEKVEWSENITQTSSVESDINYLYELLFSASEQFIPERKSTTYKQIPRDRKKVFRRNKFLKKKLRTNTSKNETKTNKINEELVQKQTKLIQSHENERIIKEKDLAKHVKKKFKTFLQIC